MRQICQIALCCTPRAARFLSRNTVHHLWLEQEPDNQPACSQVGSSAASQLACHSVRPGSKSAVTLHFHFTLTSNQTHVENGGKKYQKVYASILASSFISILSSLVSCTCDFCITAAKYYWSSAKKWCHISLRGGDMSMPCSPLTQFLGYKSPRTNQPTTFLTIQPMKPTSKQEPWLRKPIGEPTHKWLSYKCRGN